MDAPRGVFPAQSKALLLDPALFTAPYDAALTHGLRAAGVDPVWLTRPLRAGEDATLPAAATRPIFYQRTDGPQRGRNGSKLLKGIEHVAGMATAVREVRSLRPDVVHFQWAIVPLIDHVAIGRMRRIAPVVLTVHDSTPFNGKDVPFLQRSGFLRAAAAADRLIVHTTGAREQLVGTGLDPNRVDIVPHGLLEPQLGSRTSPSARWRIVQFGRIQHYKGLDLLIEALGRLDPETLSKLEVVVAGEAHVDTAALVARAAALGLDATIDFRFGFLTEKQMGDLLASADAFVFPYRNIEASGVLHLVAGLNRWIVASDVGAFPQLVGRDEACGTLVDPHDPDRLAHALTKSIGRKPTRAIGGDIPDWQEIGRMTRDVYARAYSNWTRQRER